MKRANENNNDERIERKTRKRSCQNCDYNDELVRCNHCKKLSPWSKYHCEREKAWLDIENSYWICSRCNGKMKHTDLEVSSAFPMYYVGEFKIDSKVSSLPVLWTFTEKGKTKCFWPVRDLKNKILKRTPPPLNKRENESWKIFDVKILLNGMMFSSLARADKKVDGIVKAIEASKNMSATSNGSVSQEQVLQSGDREETPSREHLGEETGVTHAQADVVEEGSLPTRDCQKIPSQIVESLQSVKISEALPIVGSTTTVQQQVLSSEDSQEVLPDEHDENTLGDSDVLSQGQLSPSLDHSTVFSPNKIFKIGGKDGKVVFFKTEADLLVEKKSKIVVNYYLGNIFQNIQDEFIELMVLKTFEVDFLAEITFKKEPNRIYMKGTNMLQCWIETLKTKFYVKANIQRSEDEEEELNKKLAAMIQSTVRRVKNTKGKKKK